MKKIRQDIGPEHPGYDTDEYELMYGCLMPNGLETQILKRRVHKDRYVDYVVQVVPMEKWTRVGNVYDVMTLFSLSGCPTIASGSLEFPDSICLWTGNSEDEAWDWVRMVEDWTPATKVWFIDFPNPQDFG